MATGNNYASQPGPKPGNEGAVNMHKSIAMGMTAPASKRTTKVVGLKGGGTGPIHVTGLTNR